MPNAKCEDTGAIIKLTNRDYFRYSIAVLGFMAMTVSYAMRSNLSVTIVYMVDFDQSTNNTTAQIQPHTFKWSAKLQGVILGAFYYGYILIQVPAGRLAERFNPKWVVFIGGCCGTLATFLGPLAAKVHVGAFIFSRIICGMGLSVFHPCLHSLIARWATPHERSIFSAIIYSGSQFGVIIAMPVAGYLVVHSGWEWTFYVFGIVGSVWLILWVVIVYKQPSDHPWISINEKRYIRDNLTDISTTEKDFYVPWKQIAKSYAVWALLVCHFAYTWANYTLLTELPTYMSKILGFSISKNGGLSCIPYLIMMFVGYISSYAAFQLTKRDIISIVLVRKGLTTIALFGTAGCLLIITFLSSQVMLIYGMLILAVSFLGFTYAGFQVNHVDLSPKYAGTLEGITNTFASIPGIISPYIVGVITQDNETVESWRIVFYIAIAILVTFGTCYLIAGSASYQKWNEFESSENLHLNLEKQGSTLTYFSNISQL